MRRASIVPILGLAAALAAAPAQAIGFGRVVDNTRLGQPLNFAAFVRLDADETLARECVFADVQVGEARLAAGQLRISVEPAADPAERTVRVTSVALIDEPVVTVNITLGCSGQVARSFVAFVDPPEINLAQSEPGESLPRQQLEPPVTPVTAPLDASRDGAAGVATPGGEPTAAERPAPSRTRVAAAATRQSAAARPRAATATDTPRPRQPGTRPAPSAGARLKLDPAPLQVAAATPVPAAKPAPVAAPAPAASAASPAASAAAAVDLLAATLAAEQQQRMAAMEESLRKMRAEAQATQGQLASLQAQLQLAQAGASDNPLVYGLALLSVLLALALLLLWLRQRHSPPEPRWWSPDAAARSPLAPAAEPAGDTPDSRLSPGTVPGARAVSPSMLASLPLPLPVPVPPVPVPPAQRSAVLGQDTSPRRELSVEELIDLEQQADFFIVLGQDDAAIDLLMGHVRSSGGISPLPYLKLLEIYGRRGEREAYERVRERFNRRFNAYAPEWGVHLQEGKGLEEYPEVVARLQACWGSPARVMETMDALLFRREDEEAAQTFDLPAYRELLFVYSIARDLTHLEGVGAVDLALPLHPAPSSGDRRFEDTLPLLTSVPEAYRQTRTMQYPVDIDLSQPAPPADAGSTKINFDGLIDSDARNRGTGSF